MRRFAVQQGFTLVELIVVIVITGVLSTLIAQFIIQPVNAYADVARRARLVDIAHTVIEKIRMDVREALPNSLRVGDCGGGTNNCLEFLRAPFGGRYRAYKPSTGNGDLLQFYDSAGNKVAPTENNGSNDDRSFEALTPMLADDVVDFLDTTTGVSNKTCPGSHIYLSINNQGTTGINAWELNNLLSVTAISFGNPDEANPNNRPSVTYASTSDFVGSSPYQRFYLVDTPVKYIWNSGASRIDRYRCYSISGAAVNDTPAVAANILAAQITQVSFSYQSATTVLPVGLLTVSVTVKESGGSETVTLLQQIQVVNMS